ncbi:MAG: DSD1 family PLP-dependent enzyme [Pseudomonadales bacterium]
MAIPIKRRTLLVGGVAGAAALAVGLKPGDKGENHSPYFSDISTALDNANIATPVLIVDKAKLLENVKTLKSHIDGRFKYRIVAKSLPSLGLIEEVMEAANTHRLMLFHQPFLSQVAAQLPHSDVLMGKPMPVKAAETFYLTFDSTEFDHQQQLQWLLDTPARLQQYVTLANQLNVNMRINIELDVGLHRGGIQDSNELIAMLEIIQAEPRLSFAGFMGYEPHIVKVPGDPLDYRNRAMESYKKHIVTAKQFLQDDWPEDVLLNACGSPTYQLYDEGDYPFNEISAGSCLVKPTDFDIPTLADHLPASYIATPVLKTSDRKQIPVDGVGKLLAAWDPNFARAFFTYGGYWKAIPESPKGLFNNPLMGRSTNQEMLNGSTSIDLQVDDWIFLRPTQSEFVFLQFGDIAVLENNEITERWSVLAAEA